LAPWAWRPKWIEAAQKRSIERNRRPVLSWDIARFGEDETVGMRREGGWIRLYRTHHKADTMTTTDHIVKAHRDINGERALNDFSTIIVDVVGVGAGVSIALPSSDCQWRRTTGERRASTRSDSSTLERRTTGISASCSRR
jgi:hypothetical protein